MYIIIESFKKYFTHYKMEHNQNNQMQNNVKNIYPSLPSTDETADEGHVFRLNIIQEKKKYLEEEIPKRDSLSKKYHKGIKIISATDAGLIMVTMGLGATGVGLLSTIIAAPIVLSMEAVALGTGLLSMVGNHIVKKLIQKAEKHVKIKVLAESKLNTIHDHISKALLDNKISNEEFSLILSEIEKYKSLKKEIRNKSYLNNETKQAFVKQGRNEILNSFKQYLEKDISSTK